MSGFIKNNFTRNFKKIGRLPVFGLALGVVWSCILFRGVIFNPDEVIWADSFDGNLIYWILEWGYHALTNSPLEFWQSNMFYPLEYSLAVTDSFLGAQIFYTPLRILGCNNLGAIYLTSAFAMTAGCVCTDYLLGKNGFGSLVDRLFILVIVHCGMFNTLMLYHYQLFGFQFAPAFILALIWHCKTPSMASLVWVCTLYSFGSCYATYLAPMLLVVSLPILIITFASNLRRGDLSEFARRFAPVKYCLVAALFAFGLYVLQLRPYMIIAKKFGHSGWGEAAAYSAHWHSFATGKSKHSLWYGQVDYASGDWERTQFFGYVLLFLLLASFAMLIFRILRRNKLKSFEDSLFWFGMGIWIWSLSLGPYAEALKIRLPYRLMADVVPALASVRVPGRFGMMLGLPAAMVCLFAMRQISSITARRAIILLALVGIFTESIPNFPIEPFRRKNWTTYKSVATVLSSDDQLLEIPVAGPDNYSTIMNAMDQMKGSTLHWAKIIPGYGAKRTREFDEAIHLDSLAQRGELGPGDLVKFMNRTKVNHVLIHFSDIQPDYAKRWRDFIRDGNGLKVIQINDNHLLAKNAEQI